MRQARAHLDPHSPGAALANANWSGVPGTGRFRIFLWVFFGVALGTLAALPRANAQVTLGDASMHLDGSITGGYNGENSNVANSGHSSYGAGMVNLAGSYHDPNFLSFNVEPFYNQSWLNSDYQSSTAASGVNANAALFSGSIFPGSISYSKVFNRSGNYGIPQYLNSGLEGTPQPTSFTTNSDTDSFVVQWGVIRPDWPQFHFSYAEGSNDYSIYGANASGNAHYDNLSLTSSYNLNGFYLSGGYQRTWSNSLLPGVLVDEPASQGNSSSNSLSFDVGHAVPWHGNASVGIVRTTLNSVDTEAGDIGSTTKYDSTIDTVSGTVNAVPIKFLNIGTNVYYTDNLEGTLYQSLLTAGANLPIEAQGSSGALNVNTYANYDVGTRLHFMGMYMRQEQYYGGGSFGSNSLNGTVSYTNWFKGGALTLVGGVSKTWITTAQHSMTGTNDMITYSRRTLGWNLTGSCGYSENVQTVLVAYTTSGFNCSGGMGRRFGAHTYWGAYAGIQKSLLTDQPDTANNGQFYSTTLSLRYFSISGSYSKSSGNSLITSTGLVSSPVPVTVLNPASVVYFNGDSYSAGLGASPVRGMTLTASYSKAVSNSKNGVTSLTGSENFNQNLSVQLYYNFRKLNFGAGYFRLVQGFSTSGVLPTNLNSYYAGVTRNFNFF